MTDPLDEMRAAFRRAGRPSAQDERTPAERKRDADAIRQRYAEMGFPGWRRPAHRLIGSRDRIRQAIVDEIRKRPDLTASEIVALARRLDPSRWPSADDWLSRDAERKRIKRLRDAAAEDK